MMTVRKHKIVKMKLIKYVHVQQSMNIDHSNCRVSNFEHSTCTQPRPGWSSDHGAPERRRDQGAVLLWADSVPPLRLQLQPTCPLHLEAGPPCPEPGLRLWRGDLRALLHTGQFHFLSSGSTDHPSLPENPPPPTTTSTTTGLLSCWGSQSDLQGAAVSCYKTQNRIQKNRIGNFYESHTGETCMITATVSCKKMGNYIY